MLRHIRLATALLLIPCGLYWLAALLLALASTRVPTPQDWVTYGALFLTLFFPAAVYCAAQQYRAWEKPASLRCGTWKTCWHVAQTAALIHGLWYMLVLAASLWFFDFKVAMFFIFLPYFLASGLFNFAVYAFSAWLLLPKNDASRP